MTTPARRATALVAIAAALLVAALLAAAQSRSSAQPASACGTNPSPPDAADASVRVTAPEPGATVVSPLRVVGQARVFEATVSLELRDGAGRVIARGTAMAAEAGPALAPFETTLSFTVTGETPACLRVFEESARDGSPRNVVQVPLTLAPAPAPRFVEATLFLGDPRPCIPEAGERACDATRAGLWNGEARAWAA